VGKRFGIDQTQARSVVTTISSAGQVNDPHVRVFGFESAHNRGQPLLDVLGISATIHEWITRFRGDAKRGNDVTFCADQTGAHYRKGVVGRGRILLP
jgi:hypothetical protein